MTRRARPGIILGRAGAALLLTALSGLVPHRRATQLVEGEGFCPDADPCLVPALAAGVPFAYLVDRPDISVPNSLHLVEDELRTTAFLGDWLIFYGALSLISALGRRAHHNGLNRINNHFLRD